MLEYKVVTDRDEAFSDVFDPEALENLLNAHAAQGWRLTSTSRCQTMGSVTDSVASFSVAHDWSQPQAVAVGVVVICTPPDTQALCLLLGFSIQIGHCPG